MPASVLKDESKAFPYWQLTVLGESFSIPFSPAGLIQFWPLTSRVAAAGTRAD